MSKMARNGLDKNPQFMGTRVVESAANTFTDTEFRLPLPRLGTTRIVMEILKVFAKLETLPEMAAGDAVEYGISFRAMTTMPDLDDGDVLCIFRQEDHLNTSGEISYVYPFVQDLTGGDGNGVLVATDSLQAFIQGTSQSAALTASFKILYRFRRASADDYIGIVQSQQ
jgi:hypothetical protein